MGIILWVLTGYLHVAFIYPSFGLLHQAVVTLIEGLHHFGESNWLCLLCHLDLLLNLHFSLQIGGRGAFALEGRRGSKLSQFRFVISLLGLLLWFFG